MTTAITKRVHQKIADLQTLESQHQKLGEKREKTLVAMKRVFLSSLLVEEDDIFPTPTVFISFSNTGRPHADKAKSAIDSSGMKYKTGFDADVQKKANILTAIRDQIESCSLFLGVWTPEYEVRALAPNSDSKKAPSVWMLEEKGIAEAFKMPFRLLIHESIHRDFWAKTTPDVLHHVFNDSNFGEMLTETVEALQRRYLERQIEFYRYRLPVHPWAFR